MNPSDLRALIGKVLVPNVARFGPQTIRYKVVGFGGLNVRLRTVHNNVSSAATIDEVSRGLADGLLRIEDK